MPAVRLAELERETSQWRTHWRDAEALAQAVDALLARYANARYRPGQGVRRPQTPAYFVPPAVLEGAWRALRRLAEDEPAPVWANAAALWALRRWEPQVLAARLLAEGAPAPQPALERLFDWLRQTQDPTIRQALLDYAAAALAQRHPTAYVNFFTAHLQDEALSARQAAWQALAVLVSHSSFDNTPHLFRALTPALADLSSDLRPEALTLLRAIIRRWPQEAGPLLRRVLAQRPTAASLWVMQRLLPQLPSVSRERLRRLWPSASED